ncbi:hypothetical protein BDR04DRAFT_1100176 [Suillus decipiens]|nr:hypothetical protein BDR04DRAFT_1100176 [Suillus decipiens]
MALILHFDLPHTRAITPNAEVESGSIPMSPIRALVSFISSDVAYYVLCVAGNLFTQPSWMIQHMRDYFQHETKVTLIRTMACTSTFVLLMFVGCNQWHAVRARTRVHVLRIVDYSGRSPASGTSRKLLE